MCQISLCSIPCIARSAQTPISIYSCMNNPSLKSNTVNLEEYLVVYYRHFIQSKWVAVHPSIITVHPCSIVALHICSTVDLHH